MIERDNGAFVGEKDVAGLVGYLQRHDHLFDGGFSRKSDVADDSDQSPVFRERAEKCEIVTSTDRLLHDIVTYYEELAQPTLSRKRFLIIASKSSL